MPRNVEIKAYVSCMASLRAKASELSKSEGTEILQSDTFFNVNQGRLKLRHLIGTDAQLVYYERGDKEGEFIYVCTFQNYNQRTKCILTY